SNIDTSSTADIHFSCLLCLRRQRLQKIYISSTVAFLRYFNYMIRYEFLLKDALKAVRQLWTAVCKSLIWPGHKLS
ncbi:hypothetical protein, partial [Psychrobacter glacincola]|uniref:hypothetical protein n=1 Tax=Psychrobacter glacincola TaxID=56810 RepID=UPI003BB52CE1